MPTSSSTLSGTVSAHVARTLAQHVDHVFGVMGNGNAWFLDSVERSTTTRFTAVRHEAGGVVAADAYFRASGRIAAATVTYGAGFTNTLTALAEAAQARVPLVLLAGDEPTSGPRPWDVDQIALAAAVGARTYTVGRADAAATTVIAIEHSLTYRVPVVLAVPYDVAALEAGPVPEAPEPALPGPLAPAGPFDAAAITDLARALAADPAVMLMDEPFGAIDPITREALQNEFLRIQRDIRKTIVFVTHDIDEAFLLGDQVVILEKGAQVAQIGSPSEILENPASEFVASFIGADRARRRLRVVEQDGQRIAVDDDGRPAGVLGPVG